jgi:uncharacterized protein (DUF2237 family)
MVFHETKCGWPQWGRTWRSQHPIIILTNRALSKSHIPCAWLHENTNIHLILKKCRRSGKKMLPTWPPGQAAGATDGCQRWCFCLSRWPVWSPGFGMTAPDVALSSIQEAHQAGLSRSTLRRGKRSPQSPVCGLRLILYFELHLISWLYVHSVTNLKGK